VADAEQAEDLLTGFGEVNLRVHHRGFVGMIRFERRMQYSRPPSLRDRLVRSSTSRQLNKTAFGKKEKAAEER